MKAMKSQARSLINCSQGLSKLQTSNLLQHNKSSGRNLWKRWRKCRKRGFGLGGARVWFEEMRRGSIYSPKSQLGAGIFAVREAKTIREGRPASLAAKTVPSLPSLSRFRDAGRGSRAWVARLSSFRAVTSFLRYGWTVGPFSTF